MNDQTVLRVCFVVIVIVLAPVALRAYNVITWPWPIAAAPLLLLVSVMVVGLVVIVAIERRHR